MRSSALRTHIGVVFRCSAVSVAREIGWLRKRWPLFDLAATPDVARGRNKAGPQWGPGRREEAFFVMLPKLRYSENPMAMLRSIRENFEPKAGSARVAGLQMQYFRSILMNPLTLYPWRIRRI